MEEERIILINTYKQFAPKNDVSTPYYQKQSGMLQPILRDQILSEFQLYASLFEGEHPNSERFFNICKQHTGDLEERAFARKAAAAETKKRADEDELEQTRVDNVRKAYQAAHPTTCAHCNSVHNCCCIPYHCLSWWAFPYGSAYCPVGSLWPLLPRCFPFGLVLCPLNVCDIMNICCYCLDEIDGKDGLEHQVINGKYRAGAVRNRNGNSGPGFYGLTTKNRGVQETASLTTFTLCDNSFLRIFPVFCVI